LVRGQLGVKSVPEAVTTLIHDRAEGNPLFSGELALALRDGGVIRIEDDVCRITGKAGDLNALAFPRTVEGVITRRIDRLTPAQQLALKVASVIGRVFPFRVLIDVYPIEADKPGLAVDLETLAELDLTPLESPEPDHTYTFRHAITREVAYSLLLSSQRRQ